VSKEKLPNRQVLKSWCKALDAAHQLGLRSSLFTLLMIKCLSLFSLLIGFYFFASIAHCWVVDSAEAHQRDLTGLALSLLLAWLFQGLYNAIFMQRKMSLLMKLEHLFLSVMATGQHAVVRQHSTYYWQSLWQHQLEAFADWAMEYRVQQSVAVVVPLIALSGIFFVNPVIGLGLVVTLPVVPLFMVIVGKGAAALHQKHFVALERLGSLFTDRLSALSMLTSFRAHERQTALLSQASDNLNSRTMKVVSVAFLSNSVLDFFATLSVALVAVFIGFTLLGELQIGPPINLQEGLWVLLVVPLLLSEMKKLGQIYHQKAQAEAACLELEPIFAASKKQTAASTHTGDKYAVFTGFSVQEFCVYDFKHQRNDEKPVRCDALVYAPTLSVAPGACILLSGRSGSGKTVLLEALAGQRPTSHSVDAKPAWLTQQPVILPGTVRENLCLDDEFEDSRLEGVLRAVELIDWLYRLPNGLDTAMTEHPPLSGGEAQRLALARLLLRDHDIWLLDEPTAHLPDEQHHRLAKLIYHLGQGKTLIWASHKVLPANWFNGFWTIKNHTLSESLTSRRDKYVASEESANDEQ
jgi:ATP-binding cassette subfamily C protein CydD